MKPTYFAGGLLSCFSKLSSLATAAFVASLSLSALPLHAQGFTNLTTLHSFTGADGAYPDGNLVADPATGDLYGTTLLGGAYGSGTVFKLTPPVAPSSAWTETNIYTFTDKGDGGGPAAGLVFDSAGDLYGTVLGLNGAGGGGVFKLTPNGDGTFAYSMIYAFTGGSDGSRPNCNPYLDAAGNLYGTTGRGGRYGDGIVFMLTPPAGGTGMWTETILHHLNGSTDGSRPMAGLIADAAGDLYGTASTGGPYGAGTVFELAPVAGGKYKFTTIHAFAGGVDGINPIGGLYMNKSGNLFGATWRGGVDYGVIYELQPPQDGGSTWTEAISYTFSGADGANPTAALIWDSATQSFYGTTMGFLVGYGNVFKLTAPAAKGETWTETVLTTFASGPDTGQTPISSVILFQNALYSITYYGGPANAGTVFELQ